MVSAVFTAIRRVLAMWLLFGVVFMALILAGAVHGPWNYFWFFTMLCWAVLDTYWAVAAVDTAPAIPISRPAAFLLLSIYALYCLPLSSVPLLGQRLMPRSPALGLLGAFLCAFGVGFAIWARRVLARSWSPAWTAAVTLRDGHRLVQAGPYALVRHPIYFGLLTAAIGMVMVLGEVRALGLLFGIQVLLTKMGKEETVLRTTFPDEYPEYERRVKRLLPWIW